MSCNSPRPGPGGVLEDTEVATRHPLGNLLVIFLTGEKSEQGNKTSTC